MRKLITILGFFLLTISVSGQIINASATYRARASAGTYLTVLNDGNTKFWGMIGDGGATYLTLDGTAVTAWQDQSGNNNDLAQATGSRQPVYDSGNGEIDMNGDAGTDDYLSVAVTTDQPFTVYAVIRSNVRTNSHYLLYFNNISTSCVSVGDADNIIRLVSATTLTHSSAAVGSYGLITAICNSTSSYIQWNAASATTGDAGTNGSSIIRVGGASNSMQSSIKEYIFRAGSDSEANRILIQNYLNSKYSIY